MLKFQYQLLKIIKRHSLTSILNNTKNIIVLKGYYYNFQKIYI